MKNGKKLFNNNTFYNYYHNCIDNNLRIVFIDVKPMEYIETGVKNAFGMTFRVHTPNLFKEIWDCSGIRIYGKVIRIFLALLNDVAQRATEINDPVLNALMLKLRLYEVQQESDIPKLIDKLKEEYEQSKK